MKSFHNIEKSGFKRGQYVGYGDGTWRIYKSDGIWHAVRNPTGFMSAFTLEEMSQKLEARAKEATHGTEQKR